MTRACNRVLLVGWDAADWKVMNRLMDHGLMPNTRRLVENGVMGNLATLSPALSPMMWTSIATGKRPFKHGILGFTEPTQDGMAVQPIGNLARRTKAVWNILNQNGKRSLVVGWWPSHPAEPINGVMVSNRYHHAPRSDDPRWPMAPGTVHPPGMASALAELRLHPLELTEEHLRPFVPHAEKVDQHRDKRLATVLQTIADCTTIHSCATHLLESERWDFAAIYYDAIDHFQHGFMRYHPPRQAQISERDFEIYRNVVSAGYVYHDMMLGRLVELAGEETTVIVVSDHGFHSDHLRPPEIPHEPAGPAIEHRDFGIVLLSGPGVERDQLVHGATLLDVTPTILALYGLPVGDDMDGRPLLEAFREPPLRKTIPSWDEVAGDDGQHPEDRRPDPGESREALEQLVALGYIERPDHDAAKAVEKTRRELQYNLALSYIDAGMHPEAVPVLADLYRACPLEFRYGIQLALCLRALDMTDDLARVIGGLDERWRKAAAKARARLADIAAVARQRRDARKESQGTRANRESPPAEGAASPQPLFNDAERRVIAHLRAIARGNERTLDYLASCIALARGDRAASLALLAKASDSETRVPGFHLQVGNAYLALERYAEAERSYRRMLELDPENPAAHLGLARLSLRRRRNRDALDAAAAAVGLRYHFPAAHFFLGVARHRSGDLPGAVASLERAIAQNPNFAEAHDRLAFIYGRRLHNGGLAQRHRSLARRIREERRRQRETRRLPDIPLPDDAAYDEHLPALPEPKEAKRKPPLAAAPVRAGARASATSFVTVVSGLPRSGTSMMMQMLAAGGLGALTDRERTADQNNPRGYLEFERVRRLQACNDWLNEALGKALKVVAPLVPFLPQDCSYRVIYMERDPAEIAASQAKMLERMGRSGGRLDENQLRRLLARQAQQAKGVLAAHGVPCLVVSYEEALRDPAATASRVAGFLGLELDREAMQRAIDPALYRERKAAPDRT